MKLTYQCQEKEEQIYLEDFLKSYEKFKNIQIEDIVHCPDQINRTEKSPDYYLSNLNIAVEIKKIVVEIWEQILRTPNNRETEISSLINNLLVQFDFGDDLKKRIIIRCPRSFNKIKRRNFKSLARLFVEKLISDKHIFQERKYRFEIEFLIKHENGNKKEERKKLGFIVESISDSNRPEVELFVPASSGAIWAEHHISLELEKMINEARAKFSSFGSSKKILLLIDYYLGNKDDYNKCLNDDLRIKLSESNLDEVWVQFRRDKDIRGHHLAWSRD